MRLFPIKYLPKHLSFPRLVRFPLEQLAIWFKLAHADFLQHFNRTQVVVQTLSRDQPDFALLQGPMD